MPYIARSSYVRCSCLGGSSEPATGSALADEATEEASSLLQFALPNDTVVMYSSQGPLTHKMRLQRYPIPQSLWVAVGGAGATDDNPQNQSA